MDLDKVSSGVITRARARCRGQGIPILADVVEKGSTRKEVKNVIDVKECHVVLVSLSEKEIMEKTSQESDSSNNGGNLESSVSPRGHRAHRRYVEKGVIVRDDDQRHRHRQGRGTRKKKKENGKLTNDSCSTCKKAFANKNNLKIHQFVHLSPEDKAKIMERWKHVCNFCQKRFRCPSSLDRHVLVHTKEKPYPCRQCGKEFSEKVNLTRHINSVHDKDKVIEEWRHVCNFCQKRFSCPSSLDRHVLVHTKEKPYPCRQCGKEFSVKVNLTRHINSVHDKDKVIEEWRHVCNFCQKRFSCPSLLDRHILVHTKEKPYPCRQCGKEFSGQGNLARHINEVHLNRSRPCTKKCYFCLKPLRTVKHILTHTKEKPFPCSKCSRAFITLAVLKQHQFSHLTLEEKRKVMEGWKHVCNLCQKVFRIQSSLHRHIRSHTKEKPLSCAHCDKTFSWNSALNKHLRLHNQETMQSFRCRKCKKSFNDKSNLKRHEKEVHLKLKRFS